MEIIPAHSPDHLVAVRNLFVEYAENLGVDLCFQGFQQELDGLPGDYAPPDGRLLLAIDGDRAIGCVADQEIGRWHLRNEAALREIGVSWQRTGPQAGGSRRCRGQGNRLRENAIGQPDFVDGSGGIISILGVRRDSALPI